MKKSKLLITLSSCLTIGTCGMMPLMTSCSTTTVEEKIPTDQIKNINAVCKKPYITLNETLTKDDFLVIITKKDNTLVTVTNWECAQGMPYKIEDMESHTLDIVYGDVGTQCYVKASKNQIYVGPKTDAEASKVYPEQLVEKATDILDIKIIKDNQLVSLQEGEFEISPAFPYRFESEEPVTFKITVGNLKYDYTVNPQPTKVGDKFVIFAPKEFNEFYENYLVDDYSAQVKTVYGVESKVINPDGDYYEALDKALVNNTKSVEEIGEDNKIDMFILKGYDMDTYNESKYVQSLDNAYSGVSEYIAEASYARHIDSYMYYRGMNSDATQVKALAYNIDPYVILCNLKSVLEVGESIKEGTGEEFASFFYKMLTDGDPLQIALNFINEESGPDVKQPLTYAPFASLDSIFHITNNYLLSSAFWTNSHSPKKSKYKLARNDSESEEILYRIPDIMSDDGMAWMNMVQMFSYGTVGHVKEAEALRISTRLSTNQAYTEKWLDEFITNRNEKSGLIDYVPYSTLNYLPDVGSTPEWIIHTTNEWVRRYGLYPSDNENYMLLPAGSDNTDCVAYSLEKILPKFIEKSLNEDKEAYFKSLSRMSGTLLNISPSYYISAIENTVFSHPKLGVLSVEGLMNLMQLRSKILENEYKFTDNYRIYGLRDKYDLNLITTYIKDIIPSYFNGFNEKGLFNEPIDYDLCKETFIEDVKKIYPELTYYEKGEGGK